MTPVFRVILVLAGFASIMSSCRSIVLLDNHAQQRVVAAERHLANADRD